MNASEIAPALNDAEPDKNTSTINNELDTKAIKIDDRNARVAEVKRLSKLPVIEYELERKAAAKKLGIGRLKTLDDAVKAARSENEGTKGQGRPIELDTIEPWPAPVNGSALLDALVEIIKKFVVLSEAQANAVALWCVATHAFDSFFIFPRLTLLSPTPRCGKTTLRDIVAGIVAKPLPADSIFSAALFRTIEVARPTLLLDEADTYLGDNEDLRGVLNSGHRKDGEIIRCVGEDHEPRLFSTWAPVMLALIGKLPATVHDRSIVIRLRRKKASEPVDRFRRKSCLAFLPLAQQAARWARDNANRLAQAEPAALHFLNDRANDNWSPLFAVADEAGRDWPQRARKAAENLAVTIGDDAASVGEMLLNDIRWVLDGKPEERESKIVTEYDRVDKISSADLADHLAMIEGRPWAEWKAGRPITPTALARQLGQFGILSGTIRLDSEHTLKGYKRKDFEEAFERYPISRSVTPSQPNNDGNCDTSQSVTIAKPVTLFKTSQPNNGAHRDGVTVCVGVDGQEAAWTL